MSVNITEEQYGKYGKCVFIDNGIIRLGTTVDVGPRIVYFSMCGKENVMFRDDDKVFSEPAGEYGTWYAYGGHRLWCSPEVNPETYYPDNNKVEYTFENGVLTLTPPPTPFGKAFSITLEMSPDRPVVKLTHKIKNISDKPSTFAAWSITSMAAGGKCFVPMSVKKTGYLPNRTLVMWDYNDVEDPRFTMKNTASLLRQSKDAKCAYKIGTNNTEGFAAVEVGGQIFIKTFDKYDDDVTYPDFGCNFETYTNSLFIECECLGEIRAFAPGETAQITESWSLFEDDLDFEGDCDKVKAGLLGKIDSVK